MPSIAVKTYFGHCKLRAPGGFLKIRMPKARPRDWFTCLAERALEHHQVGARAPRALLGAGTGERGTLPQGES